MADSKISALTSATAVGTHEIPVNAGGGLTRKVTVSSILSLASGSPGGADTQVQFNDGGAFGGDAGLVFNKTTNDLTVGGRVSATGTSAASPAFAFSGVNAGIFNYAGGGNFIALCTNTSGFTWLIDNRMIARSDGSFEWANSTSPDSGSDLILSRAAAGVIALRGSGGTGGAIEFIEQTAPAAGASNTGRLYVEDNGAGKTRLVVRFATGAAQVIATEP